MKTLLILFGKLMVKILKLLGKNAGNLPGCVLWTLTKHRCVSLFTVDCPIIAVTGTNGKTSVTNYVAQLFEKTGANIITNHSGNNLDTGICSLLLQNCNWRGNVKADYLILETCSGCLFSTASGNISRSELLPGSARPKRRSRNPHSESKRFLQDLYRHADSQRR